MIVERYPKSTGVVHNSTPMHEIFSLLHGKTTPNIPTTEGGKLVIINSFLSYELEPPKDLTLKTKKHSSSQHLTISL